ncbi:TetR/AcrR family transcriptional regulator [Sphingomonas canadensis]|uniref:TetR/AcrR family transcriptional regulator n=1 Tax=Sphingomonas canadensis TaxID=1219257 RepID=A0ABW3H284_9SPHN|nr:TetR/AcrR family transcriptional regulator [Sphingomonas canadensis]MCW3834621.1 TetR/AcrR family transcriptional regulator [Sphingomonas canadensis]
MRDRTEKRARGRPRAFDQDLALQAASARFRTRGYSATSLDELAAVTGVARPSLAAAFGDKRALYLAALERTYGWLEQSFAGLIEAKLPLREMLERMFRFSIKVYLDGEFGPSGCIALNTAVAEAVTDPDIRAMLSRVLDLEDRALRTMLADAGSPTPEAHAHLAVSVLQALSIRARTGRPREELEAIAAACVDMIAGKPDGDSQS